jgi:hypothetical protein
MELLATMRSILISNSIWLLKGILKRLLKKLSAFIQGRIQSVEIAQIEKKIRNRLNQLKKLKRLDHQKKPRVSHQKKLRQNNHKKLK